MEPIRFDLRPEDQCEYPCLHSMTQLIHPGSSIMTAELRRVRGKGGKTVLMNDFQSTSESKTSSRCTLRRMLLRRKEKGVTRAVHRLILLTMLMLNYTVAALQLGNNRRVPVVTYLSEVLGATLEASEGTLQQDVLYPVSGAVVELIQAEAGARRAVRFRGERKPRCHAFFEAQ
ncbi:hypothetical protein EYF80_011061 [Liparis tanakae]|uniref:Uncharacterized protein n=1 Tax=Liparis tanakae TaxID=230148 RepID=A0A4Z2ILL5_9TELE|nr:hypothetical protein EYF80_011061 [Liparis tanakae]